VLGHPTSDVDLGPYKARAKKGRGAYGEARSLRPREAAVPIHVPGWRPKTAQLARADLDRRVLGMKRRLELHWRAGRSIAGHDYADPSREVAIPRRQADEPHAWFPRHGRSVSTSRTTAVLLVTPWRLSAWLQQTNGGLLTRYGPGRGSHDLPCGPRTLVPRRSCRAPGHRDRTEGPSAKGQRRESWAPARLSAWRGS
jgi:hypothetical protein